MENGAMRFNDPAWFYALALVPLGGVIWWWGVGKSAQSLHLFVSSGISRRLVARGLSQRRKVRLAAILGAAMLLIISLARPQYGVKPVMVKQAGIDLMILIDTSRSMAARDVKPSRMERARLEMGKLIHEMEGNRMGLIAFAGASFVECPLTLDSRAVHMFLDTIKVGLIPAPGTDIGGAIADTVKAFKTSKAKTRAVILITDGENLTGEVEDAADDAREAGLNIYPIGIGSEAGAPIPEVGADGRITGYKTDENGETVMSRLDTETLRTIAQTTGGELYTSQGESLDLSGLFDILKSREKTDITSMEFTEYHDRYQYVTTLVLLILLLEYIYSSRPLEPERRGTFHGANHDR